MYQRSDYSESTAGGHTEFTRQSGKLPGEGITVKSNQDNVTRDKKFDTLDIPLCVRGGDGRERHVTPDINSSHPMTSHTANSVSAQRSAAHGDSHAKARTLEQRQTGSRIPPRPQPCARVRRQPSQKESSNERFGNTVKIGSVGMPAGIANTRANTQVGSKTSAPSKEKSCGKAVELKKAASSAENSRSLARHPKRDAPLRNHTVSHHYEKRRKTKSSLSAAISELARKRSVAVGLSLCLILVIAIPIAVFAASSGDNNTEPDFVLTGQSDDVNKLLDINPAADPPSVDSGESDIITPTESDSLNDESESSEKEVPKETEPDTDQSADSDTETTVPAENDPALTPDTPDVPETYTVTFMFYDREPLTCISSPTTLREILAASGYYLTENDKVYVDMDSVIESDQTVYIDRIEYGTATETEYIPFEVETYNVQTIPRGTTQTVSAGVYGSKEVVYNVEYINGVETSRTESYSYISAYPQNQIDQYGTGGVVYGSDGSAHSYSHCIQVKATYYNLPGNTASGVPVQDGVVAVDPSVFPLGTNIYIKNDYLDMGVRLCADTGVYGNIVDIWMNENSPYYSAFASQGVFYFTAYVLD